MSTPGSTPGLSPAAEPSIVVRDREQLSYLLTEAAEIEHNLMCCYLYAAYSLKRGEADGLTPLQAAAVARWRSTLVDVAIDEMLHLALVSNILAAIGASPHFERPNFPVSPGYHPAGVVVSLARFEPATIDHFVFLERPEGLQLADGAGFASEREYNRGARVSRLVATAQDYLTVGHLYRGIRQGLTHLCAELGPGGLFVGDPAAQVGPETAPLAGLIAVTDRPSALRAIDTIVEQGEGSEAGHERSHYSRFVAVRDELTALRAADPNFDPAHPAARNPVMRRPPDPANRVYIDEPRAASLLDLGNAIYGFALRCLARAFGESEDPGAARAALVNASLTAMRDLAPVMQLLARLPASAGVPGVNAGLTFTMQRSTVGFTQQRAAWVILAERARQIGAVALDAATLDPEVRRVGEDFLRLGDALDKASPVTKPTPATSPAPAPVTVASAPVPAAPAPVAAAPAIEEARSDKVALRFEGKRCIHARFCVLGQPKVFLANVQGPWLHPEATSVEALVEVAHACPSGAITYERLDGGAQESAPLVNLVRIRENGPLAVHAALEIEGRGAMFRATLCRCGASKNKPFCDGSHNAAGFTASGEPVTAKSDPLPTRDGPLHVTPTPNGPLQVQGNVEICSGTGRTINRVSTTFLCRCGGSSNKPYCDGTHARIGFQAD